MPFRVRDVNSLEILHVIGFEWNSRANMRCIGTAEDFGREEYGNEVTWHQKIGLAALSDRRNLWAQIVEPQGRL